MPEPDVVPATELGPKPLRGFEKVKELRRKYRSPKTCILSTRLAQPDDRRVDSGRHLGRWAQDPGGGPMDAWTQAPAVDDAAGMGKTSIHYKSLDLSVA